MRIRLLALLAVIAAVAGCGGHGSKTFHDSKSGLTFRYPTGWSVAGFGQSRRLVAASYRVTVDEVEGDCGGMRAIQAMPAHGAAVLLIDYGSSVAFAPHPGMFRLSEFKRAIYDCFGDSYMLRFSRAGHDFQAHIAVGRRAGTKARLQALSILDSLTR